MGIGGRSGKGGQEYNRRACCWKSGRCSNLECLYSVARKKFGFQKIKLFDIQSSVYPNVCWFALRELSCCLD